jgi:hypothetical protein
MVAQLSQEQMVRGMACAKWPVVACYDHYREPGLAQVSLEIAPGGAVSSASASGLKSALESKCVEDAVRKLQFPQFAGPPMRLSYPFMLR